MNKHADILNQLYDYLHKETSPENSRKLESHLASCQSCAEELEELKSFMDVSVSCTTEPCNERNQEYWNNFAFDVERKIQTLEIKSTADGQKSPLWAKINSFFIFHKRQTIAYSSVLVILILAMIVWQLNIPPTVEQVIEQQPVELTAVKRSGDRIEDYLRKSKVLLVGITNMDVEKNQSVDLDTERRVSRELVNEARYLQRQPLDIRSAILINDLEKILIKLANMKEENGLQNVEIIQGGIHKGNLLFKIRMAETMYANHITEGDRK